MSTPQRFRFGLFELDLVTGELLRDGSPASLPPQPTKVLQLLVSRAGRLVTRDELRELLWPDSVVEFDHGLNTSIRQIRDVLGERADAPRYIQTVPRRGYRFIAPVSDAAPDSGRPRSLRAAILTAAAALAVFVTALAVGHDGTDGPHRIAVLPFRNLSPEALPPHYADALSEELIVELARYDPADLAVIAHGSLERYRERAGVGEIAGALDATHLVTGTVRSGAGGVEVTATLVRTRDRVTLWSARFTARDFDPLAELEPMSRRIVGSMSAGLVPAGAVAARTSPDPGARRALLEGRYLLAREDAAGAVGRLERAVELDPEYALAHALLARARLRTGDVPGATRSAARARDLAPRLPEARQALGEIAARARWDWDTSLAELGAGIDLAPGSADLRVTRAHVLSLLGRHEEAIADIELAMSLDPVSPLVQGDAAWAYFYARRFADAAEQARATVALAPEHAAAWYCLVMALEADGRVAEARETAAGVAQRYGAPDDVVRSIREGIPSRGVDRFWAWDLEQMWANDLASRYPLDFAAAYARFREPDRALGFIEQSLAGRPSFAPIIAVDPRFDSIRSEPRFARALARLNLKI